MHWSTKWLGKPYAPLARGPEAYDCLGLFLAVQAAEFGRVLPYGLVPIGPEEDALMQGRSGEWREVASAADGDAVLIRRGRGWHIGVALNDRQMLHAADTGAAIESFRTGKWGQRLKGVYRYHA